jgi:uncharacterized iron-regulated membrane protein
VEQQRHMDRILKRAENLGLLFCFLALLLVETGYVAWLRRLPAFPAPEQPASFITLPPWYGRPRVEVTLLLTVLGGLIAWSALSLVSFFRSKRSAALTIDAHRSTVIQRLKAAAFWAALAGADLLAIQQSK